MTTTRTLAVDLDGTLLRSDMLFETFWAAFSVNWKTPFQAARALLQGRAALKQTLTELGAVDVSTLPYNQVVLDYIADRKAQGDRIALVTASDQTLADRIAAHLGVFDEAHGSDGTTNLKGAHKAAFLKERYGDKGFDYIGDTTADLPIWQEAGQAITLTTSRRLRTQVDAVTEGAEHLTATGPTLATYVKAIRCHQWLKNILVFLPLLTAHQFSPAMIGQALIAFITFSLIASAVYVLNDLFDLAADRAHARKCNRPFASGAIPLAHAVWMVPLLLGGGAGLALLLNLQFLLVMLVYLVMTTTYSLFLKRRIIIDISILSGLYTIRIIAGAAATAIPLSVWLLAFSMFFFFALAAIKRQAELVDGVAAGKIKAHGRGYHVDDLPQVANMALSAGYISVLIMALYLNSPAVTVLYSAPQILWGICPILLYWVSRTVMVTHRGEMHDDPVIYVAKDRISQICFLMILALAAAGATL